MRWGLMGIIAVASSLAAAAERIEIDLNQVVAQDLRDRLGVNLNALTDHDARRQPGARPLVAAIADLGVGTLRFPGGEKADVLLWSTPPYELPRPALNRTGPQEWPARDRRFFVDHDGSIDPARPLLDLDQAAELARASAAQLVCVLPFDGPYKAAPAEGSAPSVEQLREHAAAWVRYCRAQAIPVALWEIGNETDYGESYAGADPGDEIFVRDLVAMARAMKAEDPEARIAANVKERSRIAALLQDPDAAQVVDVLAVHSYPAWNWRAGYDHWLEGRVPVFTDAVRQALHALDELAPLERREQIGVALTETNATDYAGGWANRNDLGHALVVFEIIGQHLALPRCERVMLWNTRWVDNDRRQLPLGDRDLASAAADPAAWSVSGGTLVRTDDGLRLVGDEAASARLEIDLPPGLVTVHARLRRSGDGWAGFGAETFAADGLRLAEQGEPARGGDWGALDQVLTVAPEAARCELYLAKQADVDWVEVGDLQVHSGATNPVHDLLAPDNHLNPTGSACALWGRHAGEELLASRGGESVIVYPTRAGVILSVLLLNRWHQPKAVELSLLGGQRTASWERWTFTGSGVDDPEPRLRSDEPLAGDELILPPLSVTVLRTSVPEPEAR